MSGFGYIASFEVSQSQDQSVAGPQHRQQTMHKRRRPVGVHLLRPRFAGIGHAIPLLKAEILRLVSAGGLFPIAIPDTSGDPRKPVGEGSFAAVASQAHVRLNEDVLDQFLVDQMVPAETPQYPTDVLLIPLDQASVGIRVTLATLADILKLGRGRRSRLLALPCGRCRIRKPANQHDRQPLDSES